MRVKHYADSAHTGIFLFVKKNPQKHFYFCQTERVLNLCEIWIRAFKIHLHTFFTKCKKGPKVWICGIYFKTKKGLSKLLISIILYVLYRKAKHLMHISHAFSKPFKKLIAMYWRSPSANINLSGFWMFVKHYHSNHHAQCNRL